MQILLTGGLGYIGSHTAVELLNEGHEVIILDNLSNACSSVIQKIQNITKKDIVFYPYDIRDIKKIEEIFQKHHIDCCIHFAGLKVVNDSIYQPLAYYDNNLVGTLHLLEIMQKYYCKNIIFSSSASVYGDTNQIPITEEVSKGECSNPYAWSKSIIEQILSDLHRADKDWNIVLLRYFNPVGSHFSGLLGDIPVGVPTNIMPYICQVASGKREKVFVFGDDYPTKDGTGIRDFIHVVDLAKGHVKALKAITNKTGLSLYNLGTGKGYSVLELIKTFEKVNNIKINYEIAPRRAADIAISYANPNKAKEELDWEALYDLEQMCQDAWNFEQKNKKEEK